MGGGRLITFSLITPILPSLPICLILDSDRSPAFDSEPGLDFSGFRFSSTLDSRLGRVLGFDPSRSKVLILLPVSLTIQIPLQLIVPTGTKPGQMLVLK
ncbi:hypothetical protein EVAR_52842_1 [Eumeta japonica]|uniref:Uncharacterized protein n=1 Tax=Eumeta variegata TaxID=151549 RepID=A0A4C1YB67_EUMVA|nr:hypothetical protein EVAR_52842_1 [Eumeta japonica]